MERWTEGKALFPAYMSVFLVTHADMMFGALKGQACYKEYAMIFEVKDIEAWSGFYREYMTEANIDKVVAALSEHEIAQALPAFKEELQNIRALEDLNHPAITNWLREHLLDNFELIEDESGYDERLRVLKPFFEIPLVAFGFKIYFPCVLCFHASPQTLAARAINGDMEAFRCLLSLDKNLLSVPAMQRVWEPLSRDSQSATFKSLVRAMANSPHARLTPMRVKAVFAAGIEAIFTLMGQDITRPEIRNLYDYYARDTGAGHRDEDLPYTDDALDAAIRREKKEWIAAMKEMP